MVVRTFLRIMQHTTFIALVCLLFANAVYAQPKKEKGNKVRDDKKGGEPAILKNLPEFFVNDNALPKYLKVIYKKDAARLALRLLNKEQRISKQTVRVPEELVQAVYNALVAVRISDFGAVDTIASKYNVRSFPIPNVESLILVFEHDAPWVEPLKQRQDTTGSASINNIIREHNLVLTRMVYLDEERAGLVLQSREPLNMPALMMKFFTSEGVGSIEEILPYGDGNDINIERTATGWDLTYSVKFGNCVSQCQKFHDWKFSVNEGGEVAYIGGSGHTIPPWVSPDAGGKKYPDILDKK
jgi:hypothetical protein